MMTLPLSQEEIDSHAKQRLHICFEYPGLSTFNFEVVLAIILKEIVGWNNGDMPGMFGMPKAYFYCIEEQARKLLHVHFLIWLKQPPCDLETLERMTSSNPRSKRLFRDEAKKLESYVDKVQSSYLIGDKPHRKIHRCSKDGKYRLPAVKCDQALRFLRHKEGCHVQHYAMAICDKCGKEWTSDDLAYAQVDAFCQPTTPATNLATNDQPSQDKKKRILETIHLSKCDSVVNGQINYLAANAVFNVHSTTHVRTCFREDCPECRYRLPTKLQK